MIELGEPSKDDIKCTLQADHRNGGMSRCENSTGMPTLAKTTLNVLYRLTTEMGNVEVARMRIVPACPKAKGKEDIKCTLQADHRNGGRARLQE